MLLLCFHYISLRDFSRMQFWKRYVLPQLHLLRKLQENQKKQLFQESNFANANAKKSSWNVQLNASTFYKAWCSFPKENRFICLKNKCQLSFDCKVHIYKLHILHFHHWQNITINNVFILQIKTKPIDKNKVWASLYINQLKLIKLECIIIKTLSNQTIQINYMILGLWASCDWGKFVTNNVSTTRQKLL